MDLQLTHKTALVTGSTAGIGLAIARRLAAEGAEVIVTGRTEARIQGARAAILAETPGALVRGVAVDFGKAEEVANLLRAVPAVDILVNNVGIFEPKPFAEIPDADWVRFFEVNVLSGVRLSRQYFPLMLAQDWGRILFISSESALQIPAEMIHYGTTKTAQLGVARGLAEHDFFQHARPSSLLQRFITPDEVANLVAYLASPLAAATNGASVRVDGGVVRSIG